MNSSIRTVITFLVVSYTVSYPVASLASEPGPPNVLIILADDLTWSDVGAYGAAHVATPNIDGLAEQGMLFTQAFTSTAMCAPTRQQLYTGLFPVKSGAYPNHGVANPGTQSIVHEFKQLDYRVGLSGKTHFGPEQTFPFEIVGNKLATDGGPNDVDVDAAKRFMLRDPDQPFALVLAFNEPHEPWTKGDRTKFDVNALHVPPYLIDTPQTRENLVRYYSEVEYLDSQVGAVLGFLESTGVAKNTIVLFTSEHGAAFPFAKWTLYDSGVRTAFIVRWPGKVAAGSATSALVQYVDVVPTLLEAAGEIPSPGLDGRSFLPVLINKKERHREVVYGVHTNRGIIHGADYPIRSVRNERYKLIWNLQADQTYANLRTEVASKDAGFRSWVELGAAGDDWAQHRVEAYLNRPQYELYDIQRDPSELLNLATQPEYETVMSSMSRILKNWMKDQGDLGIPTEQAAIAHMNGEIVAYLRRKYGSQSFPSE